MVAEGPDKEKIEGKNKESRRGIYMWGQGQICLSVPHLTAHGWKSGWNGSEGINQNFYGTKENFQNLVAVKELVIVFVALRELTL